MQKNNINKKWFIKNKVYYNFKNKKIIKFNYYK